MIRGVIFDLDGVLVSTDEMHFRAWERLAREEGIPFDRSIGHRQRGVSRMESLDILLEKSPRAYTAEERTALAARKQGYFRDLLNTLTPADALPGAVQMLRAMRERGIRTAVGSSSRNAPVIMERLGFNGAVDVVADGNDIRHSKPDPEVFLIAAQRLGLRPEECLVIEDAASGIEAGRRAGMPVFGIGTPERLPGVRHMARNLAEVTPEELLAAGEEPS